MISYIAIGSNIGDSKDYINKALTYIKRDIGYINKVSNLIVTKPYGYKNQNDFLNGVVEINTECSPLILLDKLNKIEYLLGRSRNIHWGPRTIDLDIIFYEDMVIDNDRLNIPHIDFRNRYFVLKPMCELNENFIDPVTNKTIKRLYEELKV